MLERICDARNAFEGKALAVFMSLVLAFSFTGWSSLANAVEGDSASNVPEAQAGDVPDDADGQASASDSEAPAPSESPVASEEPAQNGTPSAEAPAPPTETPAVELGVAVVGLDFTHAYVTYLNQTIALPTESVNVPLDKEFAFTAHADEGFEIDTVKAVVDGIETELAADGQTSEYKVPADYVTSNLALKVEAKAVEAESASAEGASAVPITSDTAIEADEAGGESEGATEGEDVVEVEADASHPAFEGYATAGSVIVKVTAAEGVLPAGAMVQAVPVVRQDVLDAVIQKVESQGREFKGVVAIDVTLLDKNGSEIQPNGAVNVCFFDANLEGGQIGVYRVSDDASQVEAIGARQADPEVQSFDVNHFTIYASAAYSTVGVSNPRASGGTYTISYEDNHKGNLNPMMGQLDATFGSTETAMAADVAAIEGVGGTIRQGNSPFHIVGWTTSKADSNGTTNPQSFKALVDNGLFYGFGQVLPKENTHLYALWMKDGDADDVFHNITYLPGSESHDVTGMPENVQDVAASTSQTVSTVEPVRPGYTFKGWTSEDVALDPHGVFTMPAADVAFTAQWEPNEATISVWFYIPSDEAPYFVSKGKDELVVTGENRYAGTIDADNKEGYSDDQIQGYADEVYGQMTPETDRYASHDLWVIHSNGEQQEITDLSSYAIQNGDDIRYHVMYDLAHSITYVAGDHGVGGPFVEMDQQFQSAHITVRAGLENTGIEAKPGYTFNGWATDDVAVYNDSFTMPYRNVTLTAQWAADESTLEFDANGGLGTMNSLTGKVDDKVTVSKNGFTREGYTFTGWNTQADGRGTPYAAGADYTLVPGGSTLFAQWEENESTSYTVIKNWVGSIDGMDNPSITIQLYQVKDGKKMPQGGPVVISGTTDTAANYTFEQLPVVDGVSYTVEETKIGDEAVRNDQALVSLDGIIGKMSYSVSYEQTEGSTTITNTCDSAILTVTNTTKDVTTANKESLAHPFTYTVGNNKATLANGESAKFAVKKGNSPTVQVNANQTTWQTSYAVGDASAQAVKTRVRVDGPTTIDFTNVRAPLKYQAHKHWYFVDDLAHVPETLSFDIYQGPISLMEGANTNGKGEIVVNDGEMRNWVKQAEGTYYGVSQEYLVPYAALDGVRYAYNTKEAIPEGYTETGKGYSGWRTGDGNPDSEGYYSCVGILYNYKSTTSVSGTKTWVDNKEHNNADEVQLVLQRAVWPSQNYETVEDVLPTWDDDQFTFDGLERFVAGSVSEFYAYKVTEVPMSGYTGTQVGNNIINTQIKLAITADSQEWLYDGQEHSADGYKLSIDGAAPVAVGPDGMCDLPNGDTLAVDISGTVKNVRDTADGNNDVTNYVVTDKAGNDVTDAYSITTANGKLAVTARDVTLESGGGTKPYDGVPFELPEVMVSGDGFVANEASAHATGSLTNVGGPVENTIVIDPDEGYDEFNYNISYKLGTYAITPAELTVSTASASKAYDGEPLTEAGYSVSGLAPGETLIARTTGSVTDVTTGDGVDNTYELDWVNEGTSALESNYTLVGETLGKLVVTEGAYAVEASGYVGVYDGQPHGITVVAPDDATVVFDTDNAYVDVTSGAVTVNYTVTRPNYRDIMGSQTVTITPAPVTITVDDASKVVGTADPAFTGKDVVGLVAEGDLGEVMYSRTNSDEVVGVYQDVLIAQYRENPNYTVTVVPGTFTITAVPAVPTVPPTDTPTDTPTPAPTDTPTPGTVPPDSPLAPVVTPIVDALAGAAEAVIGDNGTPLAQGETNISDDGTPLAGGDRVSCWVHLYIILGIIVTAVYGVCVATRRSLYSRKLKQYEDNLTGGGDPAPGAPSGRDEDATVSIPKGAPAGATMAVGLGE